MVCVFIGNVVCDTLNSGWDQSSYLQQRLHQLKDTQGDFSPVRHTHTHIIIYMSNVLILLSLSECVLSRISCSRRIITLFSLSEALNDTGLQSLLGIISPIHATFPNDAFKSMLLNKSSVCVCVCECE